MEKKSILIVDDDISILKSMKELLRLEGYAVDTAESGQEAMMKSEANLYNLALLDIKLGDMEGTELLEKLHKSKPRMMKIMITGYPSLDNAVAALNNGADAYVMKPANAKEFLSTVERKLREQEEAENMDEDNVAKWIETRVEKLRQAK